MSDKTEHDPELLDEHGELIHVPEGQSRLRYLATIALVLFLLVIFVVADLFQTTVTGGNGGDDPVYMTWTDPVAKKSHAIHAEDFTKTEQLLSMLAGQVYFPPSSQFATPDERQGIRPGDLTDEDVASFLIYEQLAKDANIEVSDAEHKEFVRSAFGSKANLDGFARQARMSVLQLSNQIRRVRRVSRLHELISIGLQVPDSNAAVEMWQDQRPEFKFQVISAKAADFEAQAKTEVPTDEELTTWFHERPPFEQQRLFTQPRVQAQVAYVDLIAEPAFDATALLAAYPAAEGTDVDQLTRNYYDLNQRTRFMRPEEEVPPADDDATDDDSGDGDSGDGESQDDKKAEPQEVKPTEPYEFEEVKDRAQAEAAIYAAMSAFLTDVQDRKVAEESKPEGEPRVEIDFKAEAEALGLDVYTGGEDGLTREDLMAAEVWGDPRMASQLSFTQEGSYAVTAAVSPGAIAVGRVLKKFEREEPPFDQIRDDVVDMWAKERAAELCTEALDGVRLVLAAKPEDVDAANWKPVIELEALRTTATEANYSFYERDYLGRGENPDTVTAADRFLRTQADIYELEDGQVIPAQIARDKSEAYLVRFDSKRAKDVSEIDVQNYEAYRSRISRESFEEFGRSVFRGDGAWLKETMTLRFPYNEEREAERAKESEAG